ncbi:MAG: efflux RND transporter periplasmic adaptor subunit [Prevotellaceae bacterium]|nr:efflux RND transporter periplasmic adaptor subunit [Prevotellaceae bacterium]
MILQRKAKLGIGFITLLGVVLLVSLIGWITMRPEPEIIQGEVEADEVRVSSKIPSRVGKILVEEGQAVTKGQLLVELLAPEIYAKLEQAEAAESGARAQAEKAEHGTRQELVEGAFEQWQKAKAGLEIAQKSFDRAKKLFDGEVISAQKYDEAQALLNAATATEKAAKSQYTMAKNGAQREDQLAAKSLVDRARGAVSEVKAYLPETQLEAPIAGEVSEIFPKQGELVGQGAPIMNIVDLSSCRVSFNLRENLLTKIRQGTELTVTVPALGDQEFKVKVNYIKALGGYATWRATKVSGEFDVRTFEVRAKPEKAIEGLRPGMSVILKTEL